MRQEQRNRRSKRRERGNTLEEVLSIAALLACFVYPLSLAARAAGNHLAQETESAHQTLLTQPQ